MIEEQARVIRVVGKQIYVKSLQTNACQRCQQQAHCGTAMYAKFLPNREMALSSSLKLNVGDTVWVGIEESHLLTASLLMYLTPLLIMLSIVGLFGSDSTVQTALLAITSLLTSFWGLNRLQDINRFKWMQPPRILRKT